MLCKNADAFYLFSNTEVSYAKNWSKYRKYVSIHNKLVINTTKGVENYAFLNLSKYESNHIKNISIKTLKSDGSIIELDSSLVFNKNSKTKTNEAIKYPIPGVEPGDTIETSYTFTENLSKKDLKSYVSFYTNLPSKNANYFLKSDSELMVSYKPYNGFPEPKIISKDSIVYLQFTMAKIKGLVENKYNCIPCELPYLYYSIENNKSGLRTWKDIYNEEFNYLTQPFALDLEKASYYKRWKRKLLKNVRDSSNLYKLNILYSEVLNNFEMGPIHRKELIKSSGYFLKKKRFNQLSIKRFYRQLLEDLEIDYWAVFGRSKRSGSIDPFYIRKGEFDHVFFAFKNEKGAIKVLYPHEEFYKYQMDEMPTSLYHTNAILVKPIAIEKKRKKDKFITRSFSLATVDSISASEIVLPGMNANHNYINQMVSINVVPKEKKNSFRYRFKVSGGLSTELRGFFNMLQQNKEASTFYDALSEFEGTDNAMQIDTVKNIKFSSTKPFSYIMNSEGSFQNTIKFVNDSLITVSLDKIIQHNQVESHSTSLKLDYYLDYSYSDSYLLYFNFPSNIEVLGFEKSTINYTDDLGSYYFDIKKSKPNQLKIQSKYKILKNRIPKENFNKLKLLNEQVKNIKNRRLIIKVKKAK